MDVCSDTKIKEAVNKIFKCRCRGTNFFGFILPLLIKRLTKPHSTITQLTELNNNKYTSN